MQINTEAWSISKIVIGFLLSLILGMGVYNFQQLESRVSKVESVSVILDKEKVGKEDLKEAVGAINGRMDAMVNSVNNMQQLQTQNVLLRIESQQQTLARLEALLLQEKQPSK